MTGLVALRDAAVEGIRALVPGLASVGPLRGKLSEQGLQGISIKAPAVLVTTLGVREVKPLDTAIYRPTLIMAGYLITEGKNGLDQGLDLMQGVMLAVLGNTWGLPHTKPATEFDSTVLYDDRTTTEKEKKFDFARNGMFLQGFAWVQETRIARVSPATGQGRADDRAQAEALGQKTEPGDWPHEIETVIDHPQGFK